MTSTPCGAKDERTALMPPKAGPDGVVRWLTAHHVAGTDVRMLTGMSCDLNFDRLETDAGRAVLEQQMAALEKQVTRAILEFAASEIGATCAEVEAALRTLELESGQCPAESTMPTSEYS